MRTHTKESQQSITPNTALEYLKEGNQRFISNLKANRDLLAQVNETSDGQHPFAVVLSCIDSRTSAELIFDQGLGDIFSVRVAGNVVNEDVLGSMEYSCKVAGSKIIVVLGHTKCGAVTAACQNVELGNITALLSKIQPAVKRISVDQPADGEDFVESVAQENVTVAIERIRKESAILAEMEDNGEIMIVGGIYSVKTGQVEFFA